MITPERIESQYFLKFKTNEQISGMDLYFLSTSGIAVFDFKGKDDNWLRDTLRVPIRLQLNPHDFGIPPGNYQVDYFVSKTLAYASLNSIYNKSHAVNGGHAVDSVALEVSSIDDTGAGNPVFLNAKLAVRDADAHLYRVGFKVEILLGCKYYREG